MRRRTFTIGKDGQPKITEKLFQARIVQAAKILGYRSYHTFNSFRSTAGFPDLVLCNPVKRRVIFVEVKTETGKLTPDQDTWLSELSLSGVETWLARPSNFDEFWEWIKH